MGHKPLNGHNHRHVPLGLAEESLVQVFHELAGQAWHSTKVRGEICNLAMMLVIAPLLLAKAHMGSFMSIKQCWQMGHSSLASIQEMAQPLMNHLACDTLGWQFIAGSGFQTQAKQRRDEYVYLKAILPAPYEYYAMFIIIIFWKSGKFFFAIERNRKE